MFCAAIESVLRPEEDHETCAKRCLSLDKICWLSGNYRAEILKRFHLEMAIQDQYFIRPVICTPDL